jgi:hypothetical protein
VLEHWSLGVLEHLHVGTSACQSVRVSVCTMGGLVYGCVDLGVSRVSEHWSVGVLDHQSVEASACSE